MNPLITDINDSNGLLEFRIAGIDVSVINALRRTILSDIPRMVLNKPKIEINTSAHFHNEIMKHRIQCVPILPVKHGRFMSSEEMSEFVDNHVIEIHVTNETPDILHVTSGDFKIFNKETQQYLSKQETLEKFPAYKTHYFIDLMRLSPSRGLQIPGEQFKATIEMSILTAKTDGCFTVASTCSFQNTIDVPTAQSVWQQYVKKENEEEEDSKELLEFKKRDFDLLDAQKYFLPNSFDFILESNGIYDNVDIIANGCQLIIRRVQTLLDLIKANKVEMSESHLRVQRGGAEYSTMANSIDILLADGDYTVGNLLDYMVYKMYLEGEKTLTYCGFTKYHPHLSESVLRLAFKEEQGMDLWQGMLMKAIENIIQIFTKIATPFMKKTALPHPLEMKKLI